MTDNPEMESDIPDTETEATPETEEAEVEVGTDEEPEGQSDEDGEQEAGEGEPDEVEYEDFEWDGEVVSLPKGSKLKDALLRQQDYTKKTMELAEQRKAYEAQQAALKEESEFLNKEFATYAELHHIDNQLKQYSELNWDEIVEEDPQRAIKLERDYRMLKDARNEKLAELTEKRNKLALEKQQETARRIQEGHAILSREIKGWSTDYAKTLLNHAKGLGYTEAELAEITDPRAFKALDKAYKYDQLQQKRSQKPKPQQKPIKTVGKQNTVNKGISDDLSMEEWARRERARMAKLLA